MCFKVLQNLHQVELQIVSGEAELVHQVTLLQTITLSTIKSLHSSTLNYDFKKVTPSPSSGYGKGSCTEHQQYLQPHPCLKKYGTQSPRFNRIPSYKWGSCNAAPTAELWGSSMAHLPYPPPRKPRGVIFLPTYLCSPLLSPFSSSINSSSISKHQDVPSVSHCFLVKWTFLGGLIPWGCDLGCKGPKSEIRICISFGLYNQYEWMLHNLTGRETPVPQLHMKLRYFFHLWNVSDSCRSVWLCLEEKAEGDIIWHSCQVLILSIPPLVHLLEPFF